MIPLFHVGIASRSCERFSVGIEALLVKGWVLSSQGLNHHRDEDEQLALLLTTL